MNQPSVEAIKKFNVNELKSELTQRGLAVQGEKEELFKRLTLMQYKKAIVTSNCLSQQV